MGYDVEVRWHPFLIRPDGKASFDKNGVTPGTGGAPNGPYWHWAIDRARDYGLDMSGSITRYPYVIYSHRLLYWALKNGTWQQQHDLMGLIFKAFYSENVYLGPENLAKMAEEAGLDGGAALAYLRTDEDDQEVRSQARAYSQGGVNGVPFFFINRKAAFSGAQSPATFVRAIMAA